VLQFRVDSEAGPRIMSSLTIPLY